MQWRFVIFIVATVVPLLMSVRAALIGWHCRKSCSMGFHLLVSQLGSAGETYK